MINYFLYLRPNVFIQEGIGLRDSQTLGLHSVPLVTDRRVCGDDELH